MCVSTWQNIHYSVLGINKSKKNKFFIQTILYAYQNALKRMILRNYKFVVKKKDFYVSIYSESFTIKIIFFKKSDSPPLLLWTSPINIYVF